MSLIREPIFPYIKERRECFVKKFRPLTLIATAAVGVSLVMGTQTQASGTNIKVIGENIPVSSDAAPYLVNRTEESSKNYKQVRILSFRESEQHLLSRQTMPVPPPV